MKRIILINLLVVLLHGMAMAQEIQILSLNNSLIDYNNQPQMFNDMVKAMGKSAHWNARTQLGRTLLHHYNNPLSHTLVTDRTWDVLILQEQSSLPKVCGEVFYESVLLWVRTLPNREHTRVILPMNWPYSNDWEHYKQDMSTLRRNYLNVEREIPGVTVCPVGLAYELILDEQGQEACASLYTDDRHPTPKASYLACCMEYALIFSEPASTINYVPAGIDEGEAKVMQRYADKALEAWRNGMYVSR